MFFNSFLTPLLGNTEAWIKGEGQLTGLGGFLQRQDWNFSFQAGFLFLYVFFSFFFSLFPFKSCVKAISTIEELEKSDWL